MNRVPLRRLCLLLLALAATAASAEDWPYWRGLHQDGISRETGLLKSWPAEGPKVLWQRALPGGWSACTTSGGRLYTLTEDAKEEILLCLDARTGQPVWDFRYAADYDPHTTLDARFKSGPRATPVVDRGLVFAIGTTGQMHCVDAKTGKQVWKTDLLEMAERKCPEFGYTASPLVRGELVYVHPGGQNGTSLAALDRRTGRLVWKSQNDPVGYATPMIAEVQGTPQLVYFTGQGLTAVTPERGELLWRYDWKTPFDLNVATPLFSEDRLFLSSNYGRGGALVRVKPQGPPEEIYRTAAMQAHFNTPVLYQGHVYGFSNDRLRCVTLADAEVKWEQRGLGRGSLLVADGKLYALSDSGELVMAAADPAAYTELGRWKTPLQGPCWTSPTLSNGILYVRNETLLAAVDVAGR